MQAQTSAGGGAAPSASFPPSAESGPASDGDASRRLGQPLRSPSQLSPEDLSPAHGFGSLAPGLVLLAGDLAKPQLLLLHLLGQGSHLLPRRESPCSSRHRLCPRHRRPRGASAGRPADAPRGRRWRGQRRWRLEQGLSRRGSRWLPWPRRCSSSSWGLAKSPASRTNPGAKLPKP